MNSPTSNSNSEMKGGYGGYWDYYVENWDAYHKNDRPGLEWAGDEWGNPQGWEGLYQQLFIPAGVAHWQRAVEIGPGSGKYTLKALENSACCIRAYDVSGQFLKVCETRCKDWIDRQRLSLHLLHAVRPAELREDLEKCGWARAVDCLYSIDAMVHVDLQYLVVYFLTAALVLRPGGKLVLTLADATRDAGFQKLMNDVYWTFPAQGRPLGSGKFEWLSPDLVKTMLPRFGFDITFLGDAQRDLRLIAELKDLQRGEALAKYLASPTEART